jgi:hypothetical protein
MLLEYMDKKGSEFADSRLTTVALLKASEYGFYSIVKAILDFPGKQEYNCKIIELALLRGHFEVAELLFLSDKINTGGGTNHFPMDLSWRSLR